MSICIKTAKKFCKNFEKIENYQEAVNSSKTWHCHHRNEIDMGLSKQELIDNELYYNRPPEELIFLTSLDHHRLHRNGMKFSEETKKKLSKAKEKIKFDLSLAWDLRYNQGLTYKEIAKTIQNIYNIDLSWNIIRRRISMIP